MHPYHPCLYLRGKPRRFTLQATKKPDYIERLKRRYFLKDVEIKVFRRLGLSDAQITIAAQLAEASGRMTSEIVTMRREQKMSWTQISKRLNVHPQILAQLLSQMRRPSGGSEPRLAPRNIPPASQQADRGSRSLRLLSGR